MSKRIVALLLAMLLIFSTCSVAFAASKSYKANGTKTIYVTKNYLGSIKLQRGSDGEAQYSGTKWDDYGKVFYFVYKVDGPLVKSGNIDFNDKKSVTLVSGLGTGEYKIVITKASPSADIYDDYYSKLGSGTSWVTYPSYKLSY